MEIAIILILIAVAAIIYNVYTSKQNTETAIRQQKQDEADTQLFVSEFQRIGEGYEKTGIPTIESDISLKRGESLHVRLGGIQWMEYRKKSTGRVTAHGLTARVKIAKGLYYRAGTGQVITERIDQLTPIDNGDLYFTNKGIFFRGNLGNKNISYDKIIMLTPFQKGIKIERETGKDIYIPCNVRPDNAAAIVLLWDKIRGGNT